MTREPKLTKAIIEAHDTRFKLKPLRQRNSSTIGAMQACSKTAAGKRTQPSLPKINLPE